MACSRSISRPHGRTVASVIMAAARVPPSQIIAGLLRELLLSAWQFLVDGSRQHVYSHTCRAAIFGL